MRAGRQDIPALASATVEAQNGEPGKPQAE
jgi:hypothetical protein